VSYETVVLQDRYRQLAVRWWWLVVLSAAVSGAVTWHFVSGEPARYEAATKLVVGPGIDSPSPDINALRASAQLVQTYVELATTRPVLESVIRDLGLGADPDAVRRDIRVTSDDRTSVIKVKVVRQDGRQAAAIANAVARQLVRLSPAASGQEGDRLRRQMRDQVSKLETAVADSEALIGSIDAQLRATPVAGQPTLEPEQQRLLALQLSQERSRLTETHGTLARLYSSVQDSVTSQIRVVEPAVAGSQVPSDRGVLLLIAAAVGASLALAVAGVVEYFDDTVRTVEQLGRTCSVPVIGTLPGVRRYGRHSGPPLASIQLDTALAEQSRLLASKLLYSAKSRHSIMITSTEPTDGAAELASILAVTLAQTGGRIILVDCNRREPSIGGLFGYLAVPGLTSALGPGQQAGDWPYLTAVDWAPGLSILPAGLVSGNPFELLASPQMSRLLGELERRADIVLVAASPIVAFAESAVLAARVGGVLVVVQKGLSSAAQVRDAVAQLQHVGAQVIGTVLCDGGRRGWSRGRYGTRAHPAAVPASAPWTHANLPSRSVWSDVAAGPAPESASLDAGRAERRLYAIPEHDTASAEPSTRQRSLECEVAEICARADREREWAHVDERVREVLEDAYGSAAAVRAEALRAAKEHADRLARQSSERLEEARVEAQAIIENARQRAAQDLAEAARQSEALLQRAEILRAQAERERAETARLRSEFEGLARRFLEWAGAPRGEGSPSRPGVAHVPLEAPKGGFETRPYADGARRAAPPAQSVTAGGPSLLARLLGRED
jgi:capsular exopolysaccharide synthesis family protein